jgi:hypothetical protein
VFWADMSLPNCPPAALETGLRWICIASGGQQQLRCSQACLQCWQGRGGQAFVPPEAAQLIALEWMRDSFTCVWCLVSNNVPLIHIWRGPEQRSSRPSARCMLPQHHAANEPQHHAPMRHQ